MKWWVKWGISYSLAHLPGGHKLYQEVLRRFGELADVSTSTRFENAATLLKMAHFWCNPMHQLRVVELGTGWIPAVPLGFALAGSRVETFDVSRLAADDLFIKTRNIIENEKGAGLASAAGISHFEFKSRLRRIEKTEGLDEALRVLGGRYRAPMDTASLPFNDGEIDLVISNLVLQCIPKESLPAVLSESWRILKPGGFALHRIRMSDEYAPIGSGRNHLEYLKYSEQHWNRWFNHSLKHLNRLRANQFLDLFRKSGFHCLECRRHIDRDSIPFLKQLKLAPPFQGMEWEELATIGIDVALQKSSSFPPESGKTV